MRGRLGFLLSLLCLTPVMAGERLDDTASPRQRVVASVEWAGEDKLSEDLSPDELNGAVARIDGLEVMLDTAAFVGQRAQIFLSLPIQIRGLRNTNGLRMEWRTRGTFQPGSVFPGNRFLIFNGVIPGPMLTDTLDIKVYFDTRETGTQIDFDPIYEIEVF